MDFIKTYLLNIFLTSNISLFAKLDVILGYNQDSTTFCTNTSRLLLLRSKPRLYKIFNF